MADTFKRRKNKFAQVSNLCAYDENLSLEAKGLMLIAMALPEDWKFNRTWLQSKAKVGRDKMQRILKQLEENRYLVRIPKRSDDGKRQEGYIWFFDDEKIPPEEVEKLKGKSLKATDDGKNSGCLKIRLPENRPLQIHI
ncbi:MAG: hypothetical protein JAY75_01070 [Candidatus Thiodiazotropha taylori]|nr:hypothetical protein [Candidatus Thiodiazotropha taylori]MCW4297077.1 hypothetical protein [Candidatus Thiodiazotropha endolucinida]MCG8115170.1 hypothetical protein [Candidatus Thiodiazotropha taylori]MCG8121384.1 hypothetical protein [Candidatus Thiodiazotropha taylori]MCW4299463.1 hypothetical protein [Candidatus Thiodiazotropha endolucinida]